MSYITFIIPTIGRLTLNDTINSLLLLDDNNWNAIIIFDGIKNNFEINDNRITIIELKNKIGDISFKNSAGLVRNIGIENTKDTEWIGFLDDDDTIAPDYISKLKDEEKIKKIDICIFRLIYQNGLVLPTKYDKNIYRCKVGISFAIKKYIFSNIKFINNPFEDYILLKNLQSNNYIIVISPYITYFVKSNPYKILDTNYPRIYL